MKRVWKLACAVALLCACKEAEDLAQTVVWFDAEPAAREAMSRVRIQAVGPANNLEPTVETSDPKWPIKLVLAPKNGDASRSFTLHFEARNDEDERLMTLQFATGFVADQSRYAKLLIHEACVQQPAACSAGTVCNVWSIEVEPRRLGRSAKSARKVDAACAPEDMKPPTPAGAGDGASDMMQAGGSGPLAGTGGVAGSQAGGTGGCPAGFTSNGTTCVDVDECLAGDPCGGHGRCLNISGDHLCQCDAGYQSQGGTCVTAEDCQTNNGGCQTSCDDSSGSVVCSCKPAEWLLPDRKLCAAFGPWKRLSGMPSSLPSQPHFAFDAEGNGMAVWIQESESATAVLWTRRYVAGTGWAATPVKLPIAASGNPAEARVALSANGRGVVVWTQNENSDGDIWSVPYSDQVFGEAKRIDQADSGNAFNPSIVLDANGQGFATWSQGDASFSEIWVNHLSAKGWASAQRVETAGANGSNSGTGSGSESNAFGPQIALDEHGNASLVWTQTKLGQMGMPHLSPWNARFDPAMARWRAPTQLDEAGSAGSPFNQLFGMGRGVAVWSRTADNKLSIRASSHGSDADWGDSIDIAMVDSDVATTVTPRVALSASGSGAAIWTQYQGSSVQIWANQYDGESDHWRGAKQLGEFDATGMGSPSPQLAIDPSGDGFVVWSEVKGGAREIKAWRVQADQGLVGGATLSMEPSANPRAGSVVQVAVDARGKAIAIWESYEMGGYSVRASTFE